MDNTIKNFNKGERFTATVKAVRDAGVYIKMPRGGSGIISTRCWGEGQARAEALARICPGDRFEVVDTCSDSFANHRRLADPVRYFGRLAAKDSNAYYALADHFAGADAKLERKYLRLAAAAEKRERETRLRDVRRFKAARRGECLAGHLSPVRLRKHAA